MNELRLLIEPDRAQPGKPIGDAHHLVRVMWHAESSPLASRASARLEERWSAYVADAQAQGKTLFNGPVSRLISCARAGGQVVLHLAPSDYKSFVVTRLRDREWFLAHAPEAMARALGNSVLLTRGNEAFLGIRSNNVSAYAGRAHLIGGVLDLLGTAELPANATGLIAHLRLELREEIGVLDADLVEDPGEPRLLGIAEDAFLGQPEAIWQWELRTNFDAIALRIDRREHSAWLKLRRGTMNDADWERMTPVARHAWQVWSNVTP